MTTTATAPRALAPFVNEPVSAFSKPEEQAAAQAALAKVRAELGREYPLWIAGAPHKDRRLAGE
jgi:1-pyrroline-5-carboxylate dehydrogenase